jgi:sugar lactone lactonase YvrE
MDVTALLHSGRLVRGTAVLALAGVLAALLALSAAASARAAYVSGDIYTEVQHLTAQGTQYFLHSPQGVVVAPDGAVYVADAGANTIDRFAAGSLPCPSTEAAAACYEVVAGDAQPGDDATAGFSGDGGPATSAELDSPEGLALDSEGNLYIVDSGNYRVRMVPATSGTYFGVSMTAGDIYTIAGDGEDGYSGDGGPATAAALGDSETVAIGPDGSLYFASFNACNCIRKIAPDDTISTFATGVGAPLGVAFAADGTLYVAGTSSNQVYAVSPAGVVSVLAGNGQPGYSGDGGPATAAELDDAHGLTVAPNGDVLISDRSNCVIRDVSPTTGIITTYAGNHLANFDPTGDSGQGACTGGGYTGDGGPATSSQAQLAYVEALWADPGTGNLYLLDQGYAVLREVAGSQNGLTSAPAAGTQPGITGNPIAGQTLTATGDWEGVPYPSLSYQWCISDTQSPGAGGCPSGYDQIANATAQTYAIPDGADDVGHTLRVSVTATNSSGSAQSYTNASAAITAAPLQVQIVSVPLDATAGGEIDGSSVSWSVSGGVSPSGTLTFEVFGPQPSPPTNCSAGATTVGSASMSGDGSYSPAVEFTPPQAGDYWWYASYSGDSNNNPAASTCGVAMPETVASAPPAPRPSPTSTKVSSSAYEVVTGQRLTYRATVDPAPDGGTVRFADDGHTIPGCAAIALNTATGSGTCTTSYATPSSHLVQASYSGDEHLMSSQSSVLIQTVDSSLTLTGSPSGRSGRVSFTVRCAANSGGCRMIAALATTEAVHRNKVVSVSASGNHESRNVTTGTSTVPLAAGKTRTITMKLNSTGRNLLTRFKRLPTRLAVSLLVGGQRTTVAHIQLTVEPSKRSHRQH